MGANLATAGLWRRRGASCNVDKAYQLVDALSAEKLAEFIEEAGSLDPQGIYTEAEGPLDSHQLDAARGGAKRAISDLWLGNRGGPAIWISPDRNWELWISGGMTWGDPPSDMFETLIAVGALPDEVLAALGFATGADFEQV